HQGRSLMKNDIPPALCPEFERHIEVVHLGTAGACLAGILAVFSADHFGCLLWLSLLCFCVGLPEAVARGVMAMLARMVQVYPSPSRWPLCHVGWLSVVPIVSGYILMIASLSAALASVLLVCSIAGFLVLRCSVASTLQREKMALKKTTQEAPSHS